MEVKWATLKWVWAATNTPPQGEFGRNTSPTRSGSHAREFDRFVPYMVVMTFMILFAVFLTLIPVSVLLVVLILIAWGADRTYKGPSNEQKVFIL